MHKDGILHAIDCTTERLQGRLACWWRRLRARYKMDATTTQCPCFHLGQIDQKIEHAHGMLHEIKCRLECLESKVAALDKKVQAVLDKLGITGIAPVPTA